MPLLCPYAEWICLMSFIWDNLRRSSLLDGRGRKTEESPDSTGQRCRLTAGRGNPTESATERYRSESWQNSDVRSQMGFGL